MPGPARNVFWLVKGDFFSLGMLVLTQDFFQMLFGCNRLLHLDRFNWTTLSVAAVELYFCVQGSPQPCHLSFRLTSSISLERGNGASEKAYVPKGLCTPPTNRHNGLHRRDKTKTDQPRNTLVVIGATRERQPLSSPKKPPKSDVWLGSTRPYADRVPRGAYARLGLLEG